MFRRRDFLAGLCCVVLSEFAHSQRSAGKVPRIGVLDDGPMWNAFRDGLRELGYVEGKNIQLEYRAADGRPDRLFEGAAQLSRLPVDVIVAFGTPATTAAKRATATIPIVMISIGDPIRAGLVASLSRPGGNVTGNMLLGPDQAAKRVQLLREAFPAIRRVAFLWNPDNASNLVHLEQTKVGTQALGLKLLTLEARNPTEIDAALSIIAKERPDAFVMTNDPLHQLHVRKIIDFMAAHRLPALYQTKNSAEVGGLMSYGANLPELFRQGAKYVDRILKGAKAGDLPVEQPIKFELVINLKTAKTLGLVLPQSFMARADEIIQ